MHRILFLSMVVAMTIALPDDPLAFVAKDWTINPLIPYFKRKAVHAGENFTIDCTTNDPDAEINLMEKSLSDALYENSMNLKGARIKKVNQTFIIFDLKTSDYSIYQCTAKNIRDGEKFLELGTLTVSSVHVADLPEIRPAVKNEYLIEKNGKSKIICESSSIAGQKSIEWYFEKPSGNRTKLVTVYEAINKLNTVQSTIDIVTYNFINFQKVQAGTYVCVRKIRSQEKEYTTEKKIIIKLEEPTPPKVSLPDFTGDNPVYYVNVSNIIAVYCSTSGSPNPERYWKKGSTKKKACVDKCILTVQSASYPRDNGLYSCYASNTEGTAEKNITVVVQTVVELSKPSTAYTATFDEEKILTCDVTSGNPPPKLAWEYQIDTCEQSTPDCKPLDDNWKPVEKQNHGDMKSWIEAGPAKQNYFYRCIGVNRISSDVYNFKLHRNAKKKVLLDFNASANPVNENSPLQLKCSIDSSKFKSAVIMKLEKDAWVSLTTKESDVDYVKVITYTKPVSELDDGTQYLCNATRIQGSAQNRTLNIAVEALVHPTIQDFSNRTVNQDLNGNLDINCNVSGNPLPSVMWKHNGLPLVDNQEIKHIDRCESMRRGIYFKTDSDNKILIICHLEFEVHAGSFGCSANNTVGSVSKEMTLNIEGSPRIKNWKKEVTASVDDYAELRCNVYANPPANVTWQKIDEKGALVKPRGDMSTVGVLRFNQVVEEDAGNYRCIAANKFNNSSKDVNFIVKLAPQPVTALEDSNGTIIGVVIGFVILIIIIIILVFIYQRRLKKKYALYLEPKENFQLDKDRTLFEQSSELPYDMAWEYPRERLTFIKTLGSGAFGQVWLAEAEGIHGFKPRDRSVDARKRRKSLQKSRRYHSMSFRYKKTSQFAEVVSLEKSMVAVKILKEDAAEGEYKDLASELKILIHLGEHKNIVNLLGACTTGGKLCVILECCPHGSLLSFLRASRDNFQPVWEKHQTDMQNEITYIDLLMIAYQVGKGMDFLQSKKCVHRDLAARNVLVGDDYVMKIADFGLARDIYKDEFYLKQTTGLLPVKWMSPESLFDKVYTASSDVWSFGILLWEIFTLGGSPYPGLPTEDLFTFLEEGKRMDCPDKCPMDVYEIMLDCWGKSPYNRPLFSQLVERLNNVMKHNVSGGDTNEYLDFVDNGGNQNNYLEAQSNDLKRAASSEYLEATAPDATHPKGNAHVPLLTETMDDAIGDLPEDRYISTDDDHYKVPISVGQPPFETV